MDGMILSKERLGVLVRETAITSSLTLFDSLENFKRVEPFDLRQKVIGEIARKYKAPESFEGFNTSLFSANPNKAVTPPGDGLSRALRGKFAQVFQEYTTNHQLPSNDSPFLQSGTTAFSTSLSFSPMSSSHCSSYLSPPPSPRSPREKIPVSPGRNASPQGMRIHGVFFSFFLCFFFSFFLFGIIHPFIL